MMLRRQFRRLGLLAVAMLFFACSDSNNSFDPAPPQPQPDIRPIIFVHGQSGSAQQFQSQAMRFTSNGYPQELLFAFEYDTSQGENPLADLDTFIDSVLTETGSTTVYAIGHSRGTSVWTEYLDDPAFDGPSVVARYVNIDGRSPEELPGGVPTIGIWGEWNTAGSGFNRTEDDSNSQIGPNPEDNFYFGGKSHTEVATSAEAFALMYEFLTGIAPATTEITAEEGSVEVAGRAVFFPENIGYEGVPLEVWTLDSSTGQRSGDAPVASAVIPASGDFGPFTLEAGTHYEFAITREPNEAVLEETVHHFYAEPFTHDDYFFRLNTSLPGGSIEAFIPRLEDSASMVLQRQKEFWGDQGASADELFVAGLNVLQPQISPRSGVNLAFFVFDDEGDNVTDFEKGELFPFNLLTFLTAADVFIPADPGGTGSTEVTLIDRGDNQKTLIIPNWPSDINRVSVIFRDDG